MSDEIILSRKGDWAELWWAGGVGYSSRDEQQEALRELAEAAEQAAPREPEPIYESCETPLGELTGGE
jgi:hypothetical protein